jgi:hypothetical protein
MIIVKYEQGDIPMPLSSQTNNLSSFNIHGMKKLISSMHDHPVINFSCQSRDETKDVIQLLINWTTTKKVEYATLTPRYMATQIINGFTGHVATQWRWNSQQAKMVC